MAPHRDLATTPIKVRAGMGAAPSLVAAAPGAADIVVGGAIPVLIIQDGKNGVTGVGSGKGHGDDGVRGHFGGVVGCWHNDRETQRV